MFNKLLSYIFGDKNKEKISFIKKIINKINILEFKFSSYRNEKLLSNTYRFRDLLLSSSKNIDYLIPEIFANIREAIKRVLNIHIFDVQLMGALVLNDCCIAEMKTGEGKTITATLPAYFNSLFGRGVHIVTVNDYLAKRDAYYVGKVFNFLGLSVGLNLSGMSLFEKKKSYLADITYGTSNEFGFDYLRDNMVFSLDDKVQRKELYYAILDEIDSILIDEARTPLVISGSTEENLSLYYEINKIVPYLLRQDKDDSEYYKGNGDFVVDEKSRHVYLTERGIIKVENLLVKKGIFSNSNNYYVSSNNIMVINFVISSLKAHFLYKKNVDYLVKDNNIIIVDENTGRIMPDRRWSDGLHQAIEAKENVEVKSENKTLASITFQNYFRLYKKLSGMTGTAITESLEFSTIYNLDTISIPTNKPMIRNDLSDLIYLTEKEKNNSIIEDIKYRNKIGQPVLVGTLSIDKSELYSSLLSNCGIKHNVLNAKFHMLEANIISQAGKLGSITIATNMAGRGTDIILGGNYLNNFFLLKYKKNFSEKINVLKKIWKKNHDIVVNLGGLHVIGTERHESRRIDDQLRGRSGRQGDPGSSRFYVSMEDYLIRIFTSKKIVFFMRNMGIKYGESIEHPWINKSIEKAQRKIENKNFDLRKQLLDYDDVYNNQRKIIYSIRNKILYTNNIDSKIFEITKKVVNNIIKFVCLNNDLFIKYCNDLNINYDFFKLKKLKLYEIKNYIYENIMYIYKSKLKYFGYKILIKLKKNIMLQILDNFWKEYLYSIEYLKDSIYLRSYAQKDPKQEYKVESFKMFTKMLNKFYYEVVKNIIKLPINVGSQI